MTLPFQRKAIRVPSFADALYEARLILSKSHYLSQQGLVASEAECLVLNCLAQHQLRKTRVEFFSQLNLPYPKQAYEQLKKGCQLRLEGQSLQYITGSQSFLDHEYQVRPGVFIPRPETEGLLQDTLELLKDPHRGIEIGIGSGVLSIELLCYFKSLKMWASERTRDAVQNAQDNARCILKQRKEDLKILRVRSPLEVFEVFPGELQWQVDFIISNPPYLLTSDEIAPDVLKNEPPEALFSPPQCPLYFYETLVQQAPQWLKPRGVLSFEVPHERSQAIKQLFCPKVWKVKVNQDLTRRDRVVIGSLV